MKKQTRNKIKKAILSINKVSSRMAQSVCDVSEVPLSKQQMKQFGVRFEDMINKNKTPLTDEDIIYMIEDLYRRQDYLYKRLIR